MKRYTVFLIACITLVAGLSADYEQHEMLYNQAEAARAAGDVEGAQRAWQQLADQSPQASFNVGLAALLRGDVADARAYLQYALHNGDLFVRMAAIACLEQIETVSFVSKLWLIMLGLPRLVWALCALLLALILLGCTHWFSQRNWQIVAQVICFLCIVGCRGLYLQSGKRASVVLRDSALFAGPNDAFTSVGSCPPGQTCTIVSKKDDWCLIKAGQRSGWVQAEHVLG